MNRDYRRVDRGKPGSKHHVPTNGEGDTPLPYRPQVGTPDISMAVDLLDQYHPPPDD